MNDSYRSTSAQDPSSTNLSLNEESHPHGMYYVIPASIMDSNKISAMEKLLYALLSGIAYHTGFCHPTDGYLAGRLEVSDTTINRWLVNLEKVGLIKRHTRRKKSNPMRKEREIEVLKHFPNGESGTPKFGETVHPNLGNRVSEDTLVSEKKEKERVREEPPQFSQGNVKMPVKEHERLILKFGGALIAKTIEDLDLYSKSKPKKFAEYKDHGATIESWIRRDSAKGISSKGDKAQRDKSGTDMNPEYNEAW